MNPDRRNAAWLRIKQNSATTHWTESDADGGAATTFTKISTTNSENVFRGLRSGRVLNAIMNDRRQILVWRLVAGILALVGVYLYVSAK